MTAFIAPVVEGFSEVQSVPVLLRRVLRELQVPNVEVARPFRVKRNKVVRPGHLEGAVGQVVRARANVIGVLVLLDADDDCPAQLGPELSERCSQVTSVPVEVVFAVREFEAWFLAAKESLQGKRGIRSDARAPAEPESVRGAKERLTQNMCRRRYLATDDQPALAALMNLGVAAERSPSFAFLLDAVRRLTSSADGP